MSMVLCAAVSSFTLQKATRAIFKETKRSYDPKPFLCSVRCFPALNLALPFLCHFNSVHDPAIAIPDRVCRVQDVHEEG